MNDVLAVEGRVAGTLPAKVWLKGPRSRHPEWGLFLVAAWGWWMLVLLEVVRLRPSAGSHDAPLGSEHAGHAKEAGLAMAASTDHGWSSVTNSIGHGVGWCAMVAVMAPLVAANVRFAALRVPRCARWRAAIAVTGGWAGVWMMGLVALAAVVWLLVAVGGGSGAALVATLVAVCWQWTRWKGRSLSRCHRVCAPPLQSAQARRACRAFGRGLGGNCVASCAPMMALMMVSGHSLLVVAPLTAVAWYERRRRPHHDPARAGTSLVIALVGGLAALLLSLGVP